MRKAKGSETPPTIISARSHLGKLAWWWEWTDYGAWRGLSWKRIICIRGLQKINSTVHRSISQSYNPNPTAQIKRYIGSATVTQQRKQAQLLQWNCYRGSQPSLIALQQHRLSAVLQLCCTTDDPDQPQLASLQARPTRILISPSLPAQQWVNQWHCSSDLIRASNPLDPLAVFAILSLSFPWPLLLPKIGALFLHGVEGRLELEEHAMILVGCHKRHCHGRTKAKTWTVGWEKGEHWILYAWIAVCLLLPYMK